MNAYVVAWAAGIIKGEGCFSIFTKKTRKSPTCAIHVEMTDEDVILRLYAVFNRRSIHNRVRRNSTRKPSWCWSVQNKEGVTDVLNHILPYLGKRRTEKAMELLVQCKPHT